MFQRQRYRCQKEPVKRVSAQRQEVGRLADRWKLRAAEQFDGRSSFEGGQIESRVLGKAREVSDHENDFVLISPDECEYTMILGIQKLQGAAAEGFVSLPQCD